MTAPRRRRRLAGLLLALVLGPGAVQGELQLVDGWIPEPPPGSRILAGYLTLENTGPETRSLVRLSSPQFSAVEMHRTVVVDGLVRMEALPGLDIPAGGRLTMQPGGYHLMLINPVTPLESGAEVEIHVEYEDQSAQTLILEVRPHSETGAPLHGHHRQRSQQ
jgi:periplasmic copper chaperone A